MNILNLGSLNIDKTYSVEHYAEAGETIQAKAYGEFCGGKGLNQSIALARAGAQVFHAGCVGPDGGILLDALAAAGVRTELIRESTEPSGHAVIQVNPEGQNKITIFGGANRNVTPAYIDEVLTHFGPGDILLLQNEISNVPYAIEKGREKGMTVVFNPSPINGDLERCDLRLVDYLILNEVEGAVISKVPESDEEGILKELMSRFPHTRIVLTLGIRGCVYGYKDKVLRRPACRVKAVDTTAAGDTFTGFFMGSILGGNSVEEALETASAAAALAVSRDGAGASIPTWKEVQEFGSRQK